MSKQKPPESLTAKIRRRQEWLKDKEAVAQPERARIKARNQEMSAKWDEKEDALRK